MNKKSDSNRLPPVTTCILEQPPRIVLGLCVLSLLLVISSCSYLVRDSRLYQKNWQVYKANYITANGRVIDTGNQGSSHSEGQGYGMLLAEAANDRATFVQVWQWARENLQRSEDGLFSWQYMPDKGITDVNNATDGDILIAWALVRAAKRWQITEYDRNARQILSAIKDKLIRRWRTETVLLPGLMGFEHADGSLTINLSYWVFPAFYEFAHFDRASVWIDLAQSGFVLLSQARFGRWGLPPDWIRLNEMATIEPDRKPVFGYNAVRIPLYLLWADKADRENTRSYFQFWNKEFNFQPAWTNLEDNSIDSYDASIGIKGVNALVVALNKNERVSTKLLSSKEDYYSASLLLLSQLASINANFLQH
ncbi:MAG: glycosyl hydrolase family 8 [Methylococcales bacterium]